MLEARENMLRKLHARDEFYGRRARQSFASFLRYTKPDYQPGWYEQYLLCVRNRRGRTGRNTRHLDRIQTCTRKGQDSTWKYNVALPDGPH